MLRPQTLTQIREILDSAGLRPEKRLGQNFLIDGNLMLKLVQAADIAAADTVLEVGGGTGSLTDLLADRASHVVVVEMGATLARMLTNRYANQPNITVVEADVLSNKHTIAPQVLDELAARPPTEGQYLLVANLPYNIATPLLMNLFIARPRVERFCFSIQKEVADRITARANTGDYGVVSVVAQTVCKVKRIVTLPPSAFWPAPKVDSAIIRMDRMVGKGRLFESDTDLSHFVDLVRSGFAHRRKTLRYNLARVLTKDQLAKVADVVNLGDRPEKIPVAAWQTMAKLAVAGSSPQK